MEYTLWISLLLVVFIFPLKSESIEDPDPEDSVDDSEDDYNTKSPEDLNDKGNVDKPMNKSTTKSPEDPQNDDNVDKPANESTTNATESVIAVSKTDQATTTTIQTRPDGMEMANSGQDGFED